MARYSEHNTDSIYLAADQFRSNCLLRDGSLLLEQEPVWTPENLNRIRTAFVENLDAGDRPFLEKFKDQVGSAGPEVIRLAAELLCIYFLFPSNVGGARKREVVNEVLGWANESLPRSHNVSSAFENGIGSGGQGYNTRRPFEIAFLIELVVKWKKLPHPEQLRLAADPWGFQEWVDGAEEVESKQIRHMLLHLLFPDSFERIASGTHKRAILREFNGLIPKEQRTLGTDRIIFSIRDELQKLLPDKKLDFYWSPLREAWYDDAEGASESAPMEAVEYKKQIVLYGPPGTGKTFRAKKLAERLIRSAAMRRSGAAEYFKSEEAISTAIKHNVHRLQLHPSYSYEDFVRALHISKTGGTEYRLGYLPNLVKTINQLDRAERLPHVLILDEMNRTDLSRMLGECFSLLEDRDQTIELPARNEDGTAFTLSIPDDLFVVGTMNLIDQSIEQIDFALRRRFLWVLCPFDSEALISAAEARWAQPPSPLAWSRVKSDFIKLAEAAKGLNREIHNSPLLGAQYEIGHTYLLDVVEFLRRFLGPNATQKQLYLWSRKGHALEPVTRVWNLALRPLLEQYLTGLDASVRNAELERLSQTFLKPKVQD